MHLRSVLVGCTIALVASFGITAFELERTHDERREVLAAMRNAANDADLLRCLLNVRYPPDATPDQRQVIARRECL